MRALPNERSRGRAVTYARSASTVGAGQSYPESAACAVMIPTSSSEV